MKTKKLLLCLGMLCLNGISFSQGLQGIVVEKYYLTNAADGANALARKMQQASDLINGLAGERVRWTEDSNNFADLKRRLVGDCAVACAFVSYCGPFNQDFRNYMVQQIVLNQQL